jgi:UDP-GlcNAc3NAcA epimerase
MSSVFFDELEIPLPKYNLGIGGGSHGQNTGRMLEAIEQTLVREAPDWVLVYGDTDSTLAAALAAAKLHIKVAHVEAGLRSFNRQMPEEINRVLTDHVSDLLFTPTTTATRNLETEGLAGHKVHQVGDVMYDVALYYSKNAERSSSILEAMRLEPKAYILATIHREENTDDACRLRNILEGFSASPLPIVFPMHPRTRKRLIEFGLQPPPLVRVIEPVGYVDMVMLEKHSYLIATDSGGVQKEAYFYNVPCITLRNETEWVELVQIAANCLTGANAKSIAEALNHVPPLTHGSYGIYGTGVAARQIVLTICEA